MHRLFELLTVVLLVVSAAACSAGFWDMGGIEFHLDRPGESTHPQEHGAIPFTATGRPVDDGVVCDSGAVTIDHLELIDGETITDEDWADMFDTAMENEGIAEVYLFQDFECEDGSGGFSMKLHNTFDFAHFEFEGRSKGWTRDGGSARAAGRVHAGREPDVRRPLRAFTRSTPGYLSQYACQVSDAHLKLTLGG